MRRSPSGGIDGPSDQLIRRIMVLLLAIGLGTTTAQAQDATWIGNGGATGSWNSAANWNPGVPLDVASFNANTTTTVTFSAATTIDTIQFNAGASSYTFNLSGRSLEITAAAFGAGIVNNSGATQTFNGPGLLQFDNFATAGNIVINNTPGTTTFTGGSNAGTAIITNSGGSLTSFTDFSTAANATITTNAGSLTQFFANSDGGNARFITNAGGTVDFSGTSGIGGINQISAGSIEGAGTYNLGNNQFTVGGNNLSMIVSGTINDGGSSGGTGAWLIKEGTGTLTLSGVNTYTGLTVLNQGTILMAGAGTLGASTAQLQVSGGTLDLGTTTQTTGAMQMYGGQIINGTLNSTSYNLQNGLVSAILTGGAVTKDGVGTMTLTAANTYVGGTTINDGVLSINNSLALSTGDIVMNGGTLQASQTLALNNNITFFDNSVASVTAATGTTLTLAGGLFFNPASVTTFGSSTDTGTILFDPAGTSVSATASVVVAGGKLSAASNELGNVLSATQSTVVNAGATLAFNDFFAGVHNLTGAGSVDTGALSSTTLFLTADGGTTQQFSGVISGAGKVEVSTAGIGTGTVIFSGNNTYTGGTDICSCTILQLGNGGNTGSVVGDILNDGTLIFNRGNAYTFTGTITGTGDLIQAGNGTTILTANNGYTGATTVNAGTLIVDGSIGSSSLTTVNAGATLGGSGTVGDTVIAGGTLAPGSAGGSLFGPLTVASLSFTAASTYMVQVSPATAGLTNVTGAANLGGAHVSAVFQPGSYVARQYTILTAGGGLGGTTFDPTVLSNNANLNGTLTYDASNVFLNITLNFVTPSGPLTGNQRNVANALTNFFNTNGGIPAAFASLSPAGLTIASGELGTGIIQSAVKADDLFLNLLLDPTIAGRAGGFTAPGSAAPFAADDEALAYATKRLATRSERDAYAMARKAPALLSAQPPSRWSVWGAGYGGSANIDGNAVVGSQNTTARAYGVAAGADYKVTPDTLLGFALAGGGTSYSVANGLGHGSSDLFQAGAFSRHNFGPAYVSAALAYGWHDVTTNRTVALAGIDTLQARFRAETFSGRFEAGYRYANPIVALTPYVAAQAISVRLPAYAEQVLAGAGTFALNYAGQTTTATRTELGLRTDKSFAMQDGVLTLRGRAAWAHDYNNDRAITALFQTLPGASFVVNGARPKPDAALVSAGAEMKWLSGFSLAGTFEGEFSGNYQSYAGKGVAKYSW